MPTASDIKRWLYRYVKQDASNFASPMWSDPGDEYIPELTAALERLADHLLSLPDDDDRFARLAQVFEKRRWRLEEAPVGGNLHARLTAFRPHDNPDRFLSDYVESEESQLRFWPPS